jgi:hypothetical protein
LQLSCQWELTSSTKDLSPWTDDDLGFILWVYWGKSECHEVCISSWIHQGFFWFSSLPARQTEILLLPVLFSEHIPLG